MGRKNAQATSMPVDLYRKQIGKQDWKKSKKDVKEAKQKGGAKKRALLSVQDMILILVAFLSLLLTLYFLFYTHMAADLPQSSQSDSPD